MNDNSSGMHRNIFNRTFFKENRLVWQGRPNGPDVQPPVESIASLHEQLVKDLGNLRRDQAELTKGNHVIDMRREAVISKMIDRLLMKPSRFSPQLLKDLSTYPVERIQVAVLLNDNTPRDIKIALARRLVSSLDENVRYNACRDRNLPLDLMRSLVDRQDVEFYMHGLVENPNMTEELINRMINNVQDEGYKRDIASAYKKAKASRNQK